MNLSNASASSPRLRGAPSFCVRGFILNPLEDQRLDVYPDGLMILERREGEDGFRIAALDHAGCVPASRVIGLPLLDLTGHVILPTFFDVHFHWVQDDVCHAPKENLLDWLSRHVFPREAKFADPGYAERKAARFAKKLHRVGTFGGAVFCSLHPCSVDSALARFAGDFVAGNPLMDVNSPPFLTHETDRAISDMEELAERHGRSYAVTPRFALTTSPRLMRRAGRLAEEKGLFAQTHLSESPREISNVVAMYRGIEGFGNVRTYTDVYDRVGMLTPWSVAAHAIHMGDDEYRLLARRGTAVAHCPTSNAPIGELGLGSGLFDFRRAESDGVRWALGSDIGAGPWLSMFDVMASYVRQNRREGIREATFTKALARATIHGAAIMGVDRDGGNLVPGKWGSFIACKAPAGRIDDLKGEEILRRLVAPLEADRSLSDSMVCKAFYRGVAQDLGRRK